MSYFILTLLLSIFYSYIPLVQQLQLKNTKTIWLNPAKYDNNTAKIANGIHQSVRMNFLR